MYFRAFFPIVLSVLAIAGSVSAAAPLDLATIITEIPQCAVSVVSLSLCSPSYISSVNKVAVRMSSQIYSTVLMSYDESYMLVHKRPASIQSFGLYTKGL